MDLNQKRKNAQNWYAMEEQWAEELNKTPPSHVYTETELEYPTTPGSSPSGQSMRPHTLSVRQWIDGQEAEPLDFFQ